MAKISYLDEDEKNHHRYKLYNKKSGWFIVLFLILSLVMGVLGTLGTLLVLSESPTLKDKLGIDLQNISINRTTSEKLVLEESSKITDAASKVSPAVVSIVSTKNVVDFFGQSSQQTAAGTGFIFTSDGYILTNKHVVSDKQAEYAIFTAQGKEYKGKISALDPTNDMAILKIEEKGLPVVDLGNSEDLKVGQWVIAIGNALGQLQNTVTTGVISARERQITAGGSGDQTERLENLLQTDAAINPGNSGGPLVNLAGQVIGINTAVAQAQNIGFAIPISSAKTAINSFQKTGKIVRPMLGVRYLLVSKEIAQSQKLPVDYGALIASNGVVSGGPADKAGLQGGDILTAVNGERITENKSLGSVIQQFAPGDDVEVTYLRGGKENKIRIKLGSTE